MSPVVPKTARRPYLRVKITVDGKRRTFNIHVLIARTFLGPRPPRAEIRHLNGDMHDNRLQNLAYGPPRSNGLDAVSHGTVVWKLDECSVQWIMAYVLGGFTLVSVARAFRVSPALISRIMRREKWAHVSFPVAPNLSPA